MVITGFDLSILMRCTYSALTKRGSSSINSDSCHYLCCMCVLHKKYGISCSEGTRPSKGLKSRSFPSFEFKLFILQNKVAGKLDVSFLSSFIPGYTCFLCVSALLIITIIKFNQGLVFLAFFLFQIQLTFLAAYYCFL